MPRVHHVKKAAKDYPAIGVKKGGEYYWWKFRHGGKQMSRTYPKPSQLTQSEFLGNMAEAQESFADAIASFDGDFEDFASQLESIASDVRERGDECEEKRGNMPGSLQDGEVGEKLRARADACGQIADELEDAAARIRELDPNEGENKGDDDEEKGAKKEVAVTFAESVSWDYE
jgi:hypothetical protein